MEVTVENCQKKIHLNPAQIRKTTKTILRLEGVTKASVSIVFVSSQKIRALNKKYLKKNYATDVLAFDWQNDRKRRSSSYKKAQQEINGDVIISTDAAFKNAKSYKTRLEEELALYIIHGLLHLLDYDDHSCREVQLMRRKEQALLKKLGTQVFKICKR